MREIQKRLSTPFYMLGSLPFTGMGLGLHVQISALGAYLSTEKGFKIDEIGFVMAAGPIAGILAQPLVGFISDNVWFWGGRRRPFIIIAGLLAALMFLIFPNISEVGAAFGIGQMVVFAALLAVFLDLSINVGMNPARSIMADTTPPGESRTKAFTWMQTISGGAAFLTSIFGVYFGAKPTFYLAAVGILLFSLIPTFFIEEPRKLTASAEDGSTKRPTTTDIGQIVKIYLAQAFTWLGLTFVFFFVFAFVSVEMFGVRDMEKLDGPAKQLASDGIQTVVFIFFMVQQAAGFFYPKFVLDPLSRIFGRVRTHLASVAIMGLAFLGIAFFGTSPSALYVLMAIGGLGWASIISLPFAILSEDVAREKMGLYMGIFNLSIVIPQLIVSLFLSPSIQAAENKNMIFIFGGICMLISAAIWLTVKEKKVNND